MDFHDQYTMKPSRQITQGLKYKVIILIFGGDLFFFHPSECLSICQQFCVYVWLLEVLCDICYFFCHPMPLTTLFPYLGTMNLATVVPFLALSWKSIVHFFCLIFFCSVFFLGWTASVPMHTQYIRILTQSKQPMIQAFHVVFSENIPLVPPPPGPPGPPSPSANRGGMLTSPTLILVFLISVVGRPLPLLAGGGGGGEDWSVFKKDDMEVWLETWALNY